MSKDDTTTKEDGKIVPLQDLSSKVFSFFHAEILKLLPRIKREHVWTVVVRYLFNKYELCADEECDEKDDIVHFHDSHDWFDPENKKILLTFFGSLPTRQKTERYVDDIMTFVRTEQKQIAQLFEEQKAASLELFKNIADDEAREYLDILVEEQKDIKNSFAFYSSLICTLIEMQTLEKDKADLSETQWFQVFFRYFLDDFDEDEEEGDDEESEKEEGELSDDEQSEDEQTDGADETESDVEDQAESEEEEPAPPKKTEKKSEVKRKRKD